MNYEMLCKLIDSIHGTPGFDVLIQRIILEHMQDFIKGLNKQYINEGLVPDSGVIYFKTARNRLQIGDTNSEKPAWSITFPMQIQDALNTFEKNKIEIIQKSRAFAHLYSINIMGYINESEIFMDNLKKDKQMIELKEKGYFDFSKLTINRYYDIYSGELSTKIYYGSKTLHTIYHKLYKEFNEIEAKEEFNKARSKVNNEFIEKAILDIVMVTKKTGSLSRANQKALINWAIDRQDYKLGKLLHKKRRKLYKDERERIDSLMMSAQLAGIS